MENYGNWRVPPLPAFVFWDAWDYRSLKFDAFSMISEFKGFYLTNDGKLVIICRSFFNSMDVKFTSIQPIGELFLDKFIEDGLWLYRSIRPLSAIERRDILQRVKQLWRLGVFATNNFTAPVP